jgi:hypothetical protein
MEFLAATNRAPRTRSKALSALRRFCQWAVDEGHLRRNPARAMERPTVVAVAPTELSEKQRFVLKTMVEQHATPRFTTIFALGYWAGLRISEIAALRLDQCTINQRAGSITLLDAKGGKPGHSICTIRPAGPSLTTSFQQNLMTMTVILRVCMSSPVNVLPGCGNRSVPTTFPSEALSISGHS